MADLNGFDAREVKPEVGFEPIPAGQYMAAIVESESKTTKSGSGSYLKLTFEVLAGEYKGRKLWSQLNLNNPNPTAVRIARAELSAVCHAVGVMAPKDSVELHNLPMTITVGLSKRGDTGELQNDIKGYAKKGAASGQPQQAATDDTTPPWKR